MQSLSLTKTQLQKMIAHAESLAPLEACGLLAGKGSSVESVIEVTNRAQSPVRFVMDPIEQLQAFEWIESRGLDLLGIYHSHPAGPETVSPTDIADSAYAVVNLVLSRVDDVWRARGFWIENENVREVALEVSNHD
jgi:proteasome lid subunit RPN8/RPN11